MKIALFGSWQPIETQPKGKHGGAPVKVMAFDRPVIVDGALRGYDRVQVLVSDGGHEIDEETVPGGIAALSACGGDVSGWTSKFAPFGPDGTVLPNTEG